MLRAVETSFYYEGDELSDTLCLPVGGSRGRSISLPEFTNSLFVASGSLRGRSVNFPTLNLSHSVKTHEDVLRGNRVYRLPRNRTSLPPGSSTGYELSALTDDGAFKPVFTMPSQSVARRVFKTIFSVLFYVALIVAVLTAYQMSGSRGAPRIVSGYSAMTVLTGSMKPEIPQGSLIINKQVDPNTIEVGDTITFMVDKNTSVTHKVITIQENYNKTGKRGFQTQGLSNLSPDKEIVMADNVVGKVVFSNAQLGKAINYVMAHPFLIGVMFVLVLGLIGSLRIAFSDSGFSSRLRKPRVLPAC